MEASVRAQVWQQTLTAVWLKYIRTRYLFPGVCTWPDSPGSIYRASADRPEPGVFFFFFISALYFQADCVREILRALSHHATVPLRGNRFRTERDEQIHTDRIGDLGTSCFPHHPMTRARGGMAVITTPATPHWAILRRVEHIANVITRCDTLLWAGFNVECVSFERPLPQ